MITLVKIIQTCLACPSQWDAWDENGQYYYLRYRHSHLTINAEPDPDPDTWGDWPDENLLVRLDLGRGPYDGEISLEDFLQQTDLFEISPAAEISMGWPRGED